MKVKAVDGEDYEITSVEVDLARDMAEMFRDYNDHIEENTIRLAIYRGRIRAEALKDAADRVIRCLNDPFMAIDDDEIRAAIYAGEVKE